MNVVAYRLGLAWLFGFFKQRRWDALCPVEVVPQMVRVRRECGLGSLVDRNFWFVEKRQEDSGVAQGVWA